MDPVVAHAVAQRVHGDQRTRFGDLVVDHLARVAGTVPREARAVAWLHDALESPGLSRRELQIYGLTRVELDALALLTHTDAESYEAYVSRIVGAPGAAGRLARAVKLADLDDHLDHAAIPADAPPYTWARRHIAAACAGDTDDEATNSRWR
jgi:hypothetical protein